MKSFVRTFLVLMLVVTAVACGNKKKSGARFEDRGARATGITQSQASVKISTLVYGVDQYGQYRNYSSWMSSVKRLVSGSIGEEYIGDVAQDGANDTGVYFGAKLCMNRYQSMAVPAQAAAIVQVYDFAETPVTIAVKAVVNGGGFNASTGQVDVTFADSYGSIRLTGQVSGANFKGWVQFDTRQRADGSRDSQGLETLGAVYMDANQLFSCY